MNCVMFMAALWNGYCEHCIGLSKDNYFVNHLANEHIPGTFIEFFVSITIIHNDKNVILKIYIYVVL